MPPIPPRLSGPSSRLLSPPSPWARPPIASACRRLPAICSQALSSVLSRPASSPIRVSPTELAEIGVILLMFGVGLHFSLRDLLSVRRIAVPGAVAQIVVATLMGMALAWTVGWPPATGLVFGLALSVASTVVLLRALDARGLVQTRAGPDRRRLADRRGSGDGVGARAAAGGGTAISRAIREEGREDVARLLSLTLAKVTGFVALMLLIGKRIIPWALHWVAHSRIA